MAGSTHSAKSHPAHAARREHWSGRLAFILAATGSAVGLGNIWKFPYITGMNGGGWFVLIYLACVLTVALPIMVAEILIGRSTQKSPVMAFRKLGGERGLWQGVGWLGVAAAFVILSYYSVVAGWTLHYSWLALSQGFAGMDAAAIGELFGQVHADPGINLFWHGVFMTATIAIVVAGVHQGVERWNRILMPLLFLMIVALVLRAAGTEGFAPALDFVFGAHGDRLTPAGVLEALGHSFFTLSLGMGAMLTYGSYLRARDDIVATSLAVGGLDTLISLLACMMVFPIIFVAGLEPGAGPGLVFVTLPVAFGQLPGGALWALVFFVLLAVAALTSAISLLEVAVSHFIDWHRWPRRRAAFVIGGIIFLLGIPSALSGGTRLFGGDFQAATAVLLGEGQGRNWFDFFDYLASNWMLPLGGLGIALFVAWRMGDHAREQAFKAGSRFARLYWGWVWLLRYIVPVGVVAVFLHPLGVL
jgi:NSS family neurotransmitter:Na+ symporter